MGIVVVASRIDVDRDMEEEESREVVAEEESINMTCAMGGVEARCTEISTTGEEVATIS